jgi:predicted P-loop ATPase
MPAMAGPTMSAAFNLDGAVASIARAIDQAAPEKKLSAFRNMIDEAPGWVARGYIPKVDLVDALREIARGHGLGESETQDALAEAFTTTRVNGANFNETFKGPPFSNERQAATAQQAPAGWELTQGGVIKPRSYVNASLALERLGLKCSHNVFHDRKIIEGDAVENIGPQLSDPVCRAVRELTIARFGFDPGIENVQQAAERACEKNRFDPVLDYLDALQWDDQPRLDRWLETYLGAEDSNLNRYIGRLMLVAAVRRVRHPGCKFDQIVILEGAEGTNKSSAVELMAGKENFSDQTILGLDDRAQMEQIKGVWLYEIADLSGMPRSEVDAVKAFASRTVDRARLAYGRFRVDQPRRCIFIATTNNETYLKSQTGDRRFWPVQTGQIDLEALRHDRDQLWAEATHLEAKGEPITLPEHLWPDARAEQEKRREQDPWDDLLADVKGEVYLATDGDGYEERIATTELLELHLRIDRGKSNDRDTKRLGHVMRRLGWTGPKPQRIKGKPAKAYIRKVTEKDASVTSV